MFSVQHNGDTVFTSNDASAAWRAYSKQCEHVQDGDEILLFKGVRIIGRAT